MSAFYNESDEFAAAWLRKLIERNLIAPGDVDDRSIVDVQSDDLRGYAQCHFFAGIGGWSYALRLAGWPDHRPIWTGSCPCQPLSSAGQRKGHADSRHLWPAFQRLIAECSPAIVVGEQVASKDGREWFSAVRSDLEALGYACGAADLCAAGVGAPHIRQRLYWVADANGTGSRWHAGTIPRTQGKAQRQVRRVADIAELDGATDKLADANEPRLPERERDERLSSQQSGADTRQAALVGGSRTGGLGDAACEQTGRTGQPWQDCSWLPCADGKARPVEPGTFPLADGVLGRVGRLRAYGNAIVPQVAQAFIEAIMEAIP